ncbi:hypothetical protein [Methyloversatilis universalis]|uniref:hypothetical protein n=1 Tax=Methyloversatilis universalis TaxID=378211 RepID=UPI000370338A|nr:hypothetical protein [Methyloversatilis universalis]
MPLPIRIHISAHVGILNIGGPRADRPKTAIRALFAAMKPGLQSQMQAIDSADGVITSVRPWRLEGLSFRLTRKRFHSTRSLLPARRLAARLLQS